MIGRPLAAESSNIPLLVDPRRELIEEWALVLGAEGLSPIVQRSPEGYILSARVDEAERAADVLSAYLRENRDPEPQRKRELPAPGDAFAGVAVSAILLIFFFITGPRNPAVIWFERGSADAERILLGELWRTVTALTLHADIAHAFANALVGALFVGAVCSVLGAGVGCAFVLLSGPAGILRTRCFIVPTTCRSALRPRSSARSVY
jgi:rhomboid protease GluP